MLERKMVLSVGQLNEYVRGLLSNDALLRSIQLRGEISNLKKYPSGHWYFTLKDSQSRINCVMFRQYNQSLNFNPRDGMAVVLTGSVSVYVRDGAYQFYATHMRSDGIGDLFVKFLELKEKLEREGLFDPERKKQLPLIPRKVGVVTSGSGAVLHDILNVSGKRNPSVPILLAPVKVQGPEAAGEIAAAISILNRRDDVDVIIVGRGGGSLEDLWPFNEEIVARAIAGSRKPVVSAVGHETDFTIADFVADLRAATPSQAAEFVFCDVNELTGEINGLTLSMESAIHQKLMELESKLRFFEKQLIRQSPQNQLLIRTNEVNLLGNRLRTAIRAKLETAEKKLETCRAKRVALGPQQVLDRGYAVVMKQGRPVTTIKDIQIGDRIELTLCDGKALLTAETVETGKDDGNASQEKGNLL